MTQSGLFLADAARALGVSTSASRKRPPESPRDKSTPSTTSRITTAEFRLEMESDERWLDVGELTEFSKLYGQPLESFPALTWQATRQR